MMSLRNSDKPLVSYYWWQDVETIVITVVAKVSKIDKVKVIFSEKFIDIRLKSAPATAYHLQLGLFGLIIPGLCSYSILSAKLELRLKKLKPSMWIELEGEIIKNSCRNCTQSSDMPLGLA